MSNTDRCRLRQRANDLMPPMCHPELEEQIARRIADTLNAAVAENEAFWANKRAEKESRA